MSLSPQMEGRTGLKVFRLSDVPPAVRLKAAQKCADELARSGIDPITAVFETLKLEAIARDPVAAAETMKADCRNEPRVVSLEEWEKATRPGRRW